MNDPTQTGASEASTGPDLTQGIAQAARAATSRSVEIVGGGLALLFASVEETPSDAAPQLRAAAGFATPTAARQASEALLPVLRDLRERTEPTPYAPLDSLGVRGAGGLVGVPLCVGSRWHGVLLVAAPNTVSDAARQALSHVSEIVAIRLDHALLAAGKADAAGGAPPEEDAEEILKLSEALFAQDIELRRSNEQLGKIEKLKKDFIEKMSRELRAPLNNIIEAIISVLASDTDGLSEESRSGLRGALDEGTSFLRTLQNILDLWRIKQGELPVEVQDVNFREVVEEVTFSIQDAFEGKPVVVERSLQEPFPKIRTDLAKLHQVLYLLLDNAAKFTPQGTIEVSARVENDRLCCSIRDTGIGIAPDDQESVFDEFYQVDDTGSNRFRGAGLGLSLVQDLITLLEGTLALRSEIGQGTTVDIEIPIDVVG